MKRPSLLTLMFLSSLAIAESPTLESPAEAVPLVPVLPEADEWWRICSNPDLGDLAGPDPDHEDIVDHGFIQTGKGDWRLWACIRGTGVSRLVYGWRSPSLERSDWEETGVEIRADAAWGEKAGKMGETAGAPFFIRDREGNVLCFYHSHGFRLMKSKDGETFRRVDLGNGKNKATIPGGRDVMILEHDGRYISYATVTAYEPGKPRQKENLNSWVVASVSDDLIHWQGRHIVSKGGAGGFGPVEAESPFVVYRDGYFYLFRSSSTTFRTTVYRSQDPLDFGIDDDSKLVASFPLKAPEIVCHDGTWYISDLHDFRGIRLGKLTWRRDGE